MVIYVRAKTNHMMFTPFLLLPYIAKTNFHLATYNFRRFFTVWLLSWYPHQLRKCSYTNKPIKYITKQEGHGGPISLT